MKQTILSVILSFSLAVMTPGAVEIAKAETVPSEKQATVSLENGSYEEGSVIVTLASPDETPLTKEGTTSFDKHIRVEDSYDFGDASVLGATKKSRQFFSDKTFTVSQVTSDEYSTEELMDRLEDNAYVVNVEPDYHMYKMGSTNDTLSDAQWDLDGGGLFSGIRDRRAGGICERGAVQGAYNEHRSSAYRRPGKKGRKQCRCRDS